MKRRSFLKGVLGCAALAWAPLRSNEDEHEWLEPFSIKRALEGDI